MISLYLENSIIGSLFRFFSPYFSTATRPTRFLLTWLVIAQVALQAFPSLRFLHRNFLSQVTHRCLNSYYRALQNETVTSRSLRLQTAQLACSLIPAALQKVVSRFFRKFISSASKYRNQIYGFSSSFGCSISILNRCSMSI